MKYGYYNSPFEEYSNKIIKGFFDNNEEASKLTENLNLKHFQELEKNAISDVVKSRYITLTIQEAIDYIVKRITK